MTWRLVRSYGVFLILFLCLLILIQVFGVPGTANRGVFSLHRDKTLGNLELVSGLLSQGLSNWFSERRTDVDGLASSPLFRRAVEEGGANSSSEVAAFLKTHQGVESVNLIAPVLAPEAYRTPGYTETIEIHNNADAQSRLRIVRQLFSVRDPDKLIAILVAECRISEAILPIVMSVDLLRARDWDCEVIDSNGFPVLLFQAAPQPVPSSFAPVRAALGGTEGPYEGPDQSGRKVLAFGRQVRLSGGLSLALALSVDRDRALQPARDDLARVFLLWSAVFLGGMILSVVLARKISRPVKELVAVARKIEAGDLQATASVRDRTEIGQLATVFNAMVVRLQTRHEDRIRGISNSLTGGMIYQVLTFADGGRRFTYVSDSVRQMYGVGPEEAMADANLIYGRVFHEDLPDLQQRENASIASLSPFRAEVRIQNPSGTLRWSSLVSTPTPLPDGSVRWDGIEFVITEQKQAEARILSQLEQIREKEAQYHALADSGQALIWTSGPDRLCHYFNAPWLRFTGRTLEQELGAGWLEGVHPEDLKRYIDTSAAAFDRREPFEIEFRLRNHDGDYRWIVDRGTPNYNLKGEFLGYIAHCYDITDKRRALETMQRNDKLESLGVLAGGIAHDFNNLLAGVFAYLQMARDASEGNAAAIRHLDKALGAFHRAKDLTRQLLTFSKGGEPIRQSTVLSPLLEETTKFALSGSPILCEFELPTTLWPCDIDVNQIAQVVDNIVINAVQAMPLGGKLTVSARNEDSPSGQRVAVSFQDTGIGMSSELLPRIFDPFFTTKQKGTGLGLATAYSILQKHGGSIDVESSPGKGTTFTLKLPASVGRPVAAADEATADHRGEGTIVVMDDEDMVRDLARHWLEVAGYVVVDTKDGDETLGYFANLGHAEPPRCAILDLTIPGGKGGRETAEQLRKNWPDLPIFASSGYSEDPVMARPGDFGFTGSIAKPYLKGDLLLLLSRHLAKDGTETTPP